MKVGILTMHRVVNYGSFMQAFALKRAIEELGHTVQFLDFRNGTPRHNGKKVDKPGFVEKLMSLPGRFVEAPTLVRKRRFRSKLQACFRRNCWPALGAPKEPVYDIDFDAIIIGSDEVFNYTQNHAFGYVPVLFGHGVKAPILASYAASAGYASWDDVIADGMVDELASGFHRFTHLAVRDENTRALVQNCSGRVPELVIDPTLIYSFDPHIPGETRVAPGYVLVYAYEGRMESIEEVIAVRGFAEREGLRVVSVGAFHGWCDENVVVPPFEMLRVFANAEYVVTDTFHGSIFAMKARRQLATFVREANRWGSNSNKVRFLMEQFGMESRVVSNISEIDTVLKRSSPYEQFDERHRVLVERSCAYLSSVFL